MGFFRKNYEDKFSFEDEYRMSMQKQKRNDFLNSLKVEKTNKVENIIDEDKAFLDLFD